MKKINYTMALRETSGRVRRLQLKMDEANRAARADSLLSVDKVATYINAIRLLGIAVDRHQSLLIRQQTHDHLVARGLRK